MGRVLLSASIGLVVLYMQSAIGQTPAISQTQSMREATPVVPCTTASAAISPVPSAAANIGEFHSQLEEIKKTLNGLAENSNTKDYTPSVMALCGVVFAAFLPAIIAVWAQLKRAKFEIGNSIVQWRLQQLSELYGPLYALFRESNALYRHMNKVLAKADPSRFRIREDSGTDRADGVIFEIDLDGNWTRFRTVLHLHEVYGRGYGVEEYFDRIVEIGSRIVKVIEEKAGYVLPDQEELSSLFGQYLAHYSVLERLNFQFKERRERSKPDMLASNASIDKPPMPVDESAVFPGEIQKLVDAGFKTINDALRDWSRKAS